MLLHVHLGNPVKRLADRMNHAVLGIGPASISHLILKLFNGTN